MLCESFNMQKCLQDTSGGWGQAHHTQISVGLSAGTFSWKQNETARADAGPGQKLSKDPKPTPLTPVSRASHPMGSTIILKALGKPAAASPLPSGAALLPEFAGREECKVETTPKSVSHQAPSSQFSNLVGPGWSRLDPPPHRCQNNTELRERGSLP